MPHSPINTTRNIPKQLLATIRWILPTALETVYYTAICLVTFAISSLSIVKNQLQSIPADFGARQAILNSLDSLLGNLVGEHTLNVIVNGLFWGLVGCVIYIVIWLIRNFCLDVNNDLAVKQYVYPKGADRYRPLKNLLEHGVFRIACAVVLLVYLNILTGVLLPTWQTSYRLVVESWPDSKNILHGGVVLVEQIFLMHAVIVLTRLSLLRKRIFSR